MVKRKKTAPLPAPKTVPAPVGNKPGQALAQTLTQISGLNRLRSSRLRTSGGYQP